MHRINGNIQKDQTPQEALSDYIPLTILFILVVAGIILAIIKY